MAIMIVSTSIVTGFKKEISGKVFGFWGHVHISNNYTASSLSFEASPVNAWQTYYNDLDTIGRIQYYEPYIDASASLMQNASNPLFWALVLGVILWVCILIYRLRSKLSKTWFYLGSLCSILLISLGGIGHPIQLMESERLVESYGGIKNIQQYASKEGIIKTKQEIEGIILRGVSSDFNFSYLATNLVKGDVLDFNAENDILISKNTADRLLDVGDSFDLLVQMNNQ